MREQSFILYFRTSDTKDAERIDITADNCGIAVKRVNIDDDPEAAKIASQLTEKNKFPVLRIGEEKVQAVLFNPNDALIKLIAGEDSYEFNLQKPTIYTTTWCGNCRLLKEWLEDNNCSYKEKNIEDNDSLPEKVMQWSNGRRILPTVEFKGVGRFFNPGIDFISRIM